MSPQPPLTPSHSPGVSRRPSCRRGSRAPFPPGRDRLPWLEPSQSAAPRSPRRGECGNGPKPITGHGGAGGAWRGPPARGPFKCANFTLPPRDPLAPGLAGGAPAGAASGCAPAIGRQHPSVRAELYSDWLTRRWSRRGGGGRRFPEEGSGGRPRGRGPGRASGGAGRVWGCGCGSHRCAAPRGS